MNGFAVGLHGAGIVTLYNENNDGRFYKHSSSSIAEGKTINVMSLASSNDDTYIAVNTKLPKNVSIGDGRIIKDDDGKYVQTIGPAGAQNLKK